MVELQIISKILNEKSTAIYKTSGITLDYFLLYKEQMSFILTHEELYGSVPDKETFCSKFLDFNVIAVAESDKYLIEAFSEEYIHAQTVPILMKAAELMSTDANEAVNYLRAGIENLPKLSSSIGTDIITTANERFEQWQIKKSNPTEFYIPSGFLELDKITGGWSRGEELIVVFARTGQGKTFFVLKALEYAWKNNYRVGFISPEMSPCKVGYRFDTFNAGLSNWALNKGEEVEGYENYILDLTKNKTPFNVATLKDFSNDVTVPKIKHYIESNKLDLLAIDGISYISDVRYKRGDSRTISLANISQDLMTVSVETGAPIILVQQANRKATEEESAPDISTIRDSDGIAFNASIILSLRQKNGALQVNIGKNRNGQTGGDLMYTWSIDKGIYTFVPTEENSSPEQVEKVRKHFEKDEF